MSQKIEEIVLKHLELLNVELQREVPEFELALEIELENSELNLSYFAYKAGSGKDADPEFKYGGSWHLN